MRRYTTPKHIFNVGTDLTNASMIFITYQQDGQTVVEKTIDDISVEKDKISIILSQEETAKFKETVGGLNKVYIQIRAGFEDGSRAVSTKVTTTVKGVLKGGII